MIAAGDVSGAGGSAGPPGLRRVVCVTNPQGLHMRPAAAFAKCARLFQSRVSVSRAADGAAAETVNGKDLMGLILLAAAQGTELVLEAAGDDAPQALDALSRVLVEGQES